MAFSGMNSREKTLIAVLGVVIVIALIGIGILLARLLTGDGAGEPEVAITPPPAVPSAAALPPETATLVANPDLDAAANPPQAAGGGQPVAVTRIESPGPLLPVILMDQPLRPDRTYRVEITAVDGSKVAIRGSWSQSAKKADGSLELPLPESIEGTTPLNIVLKSPVANATAWSCSVSAGPQDLLGQPPKLVITVWDDTGSE